jgi:hypothetical protein
VCKKIIGTWRTPIFLKCVVIKKKKDLGSDGPQNLIFGTWDTPIFLMLIIKDLGVATPESNIGT